MGTDRDEGRGNSVYCSAIHALLRPELKIEERIWQAIRGQGFQGIIKDNGSPFPPVILVLFVAKNQFPVLGSLSLNLCPSVVKKIPL